MDQLSCIKHQLKQYDLGDILNVTPLIGGTVNSNYLIESTKGQWVFTILESLPKALAEPLSQFLVFLNHHEFPTPILQSMRTGEVLSDFQDKPSLVVNHISGKSPLYPTLKQCHQIGSSLASLHQLTQHYLHPLTNTMDNAWRNQTAQQLLVQMTVEEQACVQSTLEIQANLPYDKLPQGIIHFDLFRDNTLFAEDKLQSIIDFYYACSDTFLMDISIALNDWCTDWQNETRKILPEKVKALLTGYELQRPLLEIEQTVLPHMLKISALHFWLARTQSHKKDPMDYKKIFLQQFKV